MMMRSRPAPAAVVTSIVWSSSARRSMVAGD